jgi:hypothetical protein
MRFGIWFPVENKGKKGKGKNEEFSCSCFISISSPFSTSVCGPKGGTEKESKE